jgi:hypothetical protein
VARGIRRRGEHGISRKTIRAGKAGIVSAEPVVHSLCTLFAQGPRVPAGTRPSLRPLFSEEHETATPRVRCVPRECGVVRCGCLKIESRDAWGLPAPSNERSQSVFACAGAPASPDTLRPDGLSVACRVVARGDKPAFALWATARQPSLASRAKAGGRGRTRTYEAMRRLIYSQLPLPLGTLSRPNSVGRHPRLVAADRPYDDADRRSTQLSGSGGRRVYGRRAVAKSTKSSRSSASFFRPKLPSPGTRDTRPHEQSRPQAAVPSRRH